MRKAQVDFALDMVFRSQAWRDILRQIKGNEITEQSGEEVSSYVMEKVGNRLAAAVTDAKKAAAV